jgi:Tfp pilus assembly protein PilV
MDKPFSPTTGISSHKRGFALIVTLSVLVVVIALTGVLVGYLDTVREESVQTKAMLQANLYFKDMKEIISKFKQKKTLYAVLYAAPIPLQSEDGKFSLSVSCKPMANGVNINWLAFSNNQVMIPQYNAASKVFDTLVDEYELENPSRLEEMLLEVIREQSGADPEKQSRLRQKNGIISYQQFMQILSRYQFETDDRNIGKVPWDKYFVFRPSSKVPDENMIEGDYLSPELIALLFDIDIETLKEEWAPGEDALKKLLAKYSIPYEAKLFSKKFMEQSYCEVVYDFKGERFRFAFVDSEGEVKDFEFYGKQ